MFAQMNRPRHQRARADQAQMQHAGDLEEESE
jgi:hypothetical protein